MGKGSAALPRRLRTTCTPRAVPPPLFPAPRVPHFLYLFPSHLADTGNEGVYVHHIPRPINKIDERSGRREGLGRA